MVPLSQYAPTPTSHSFPEELELETAKICPYNLVTIPTYGPTVYHIFRRLHLLGIATSWRWKATRNVSVAMRVNISNMLLDAEYDMLVTSARFAQDRADRESGIDEELIAVCDGLVTAAQIFLFAALRTMPIRARIVEIYLSRLKLCLERERLLETWNVYASHDALLWVLFISAVAATGRPERENIVSELREVVALLGIKSQESLEQHLMGFAWADFFVQYLGGVANELFRSRSEPSVRVP